MKIVLCNNISQITTEYSSYPIINEEAYRIALDKDVIYEPKDEKWISLLAFKEALSDLKANLEQNISSIFVFTANDKKNALLNKLLDRYIVEVIFWGCK